MSNLLIYIAKVSLVTGILFTVYRIFLSNTTFHTINRFALLFIMLFSLICPALQFQHTFNTSLNPINIWIYEIENIPSSDAVPAHIEKSMHHITLTWILVRLYFLVVLVLSIRFIQRLKFLFDMKKKAKQRNINDNSFLLTDKTHAPFSFFDWVFIPCNYIYFKGLPSVIRHEKTHASQWHSFDLVLAEIFCIAFWFNPFVYLLKRSLKTVHEYLADKQVLMDNISLSDYLTILKTGHELSYISGITNQFTSTTIKKRVKMITKNKTQQIHKLTYIILVLCALLMIPAFAQSPPADLVPNIKPIAGENIQKISSRYGMREHPVYKEMKMHYGIDLKAKEGTPVVATADGKIVKVAFEEEGKGYGRVVFIQHGATYSTVYAQLSDFNVKTGDEVKQGDIIGYVGSSGMSTGSHLHYEVVKNGERVDPEDYFE